MTLSKVKTFAKIAGDATFDGSSSAGRLLNRDSDHHRLIDLVNDHLFD